MIFKKLPLIAFASAALALFVPTASARIHFGDFLPPLPSISINGGGDGDGPVFYGDDDPPEYFYTTDRYGHRIRHLREGHGYHNGHRIGGHGRSTNGGHRAGSAHQSRGGGGRQVSHGGGSRKH